jgi:7-cyano-7-deazaguanine synthase
MRRVVTSKRDRHAAKKKAVLVLLSGGLDSAACVAFFRAQHYDVSALFVEYGQGALLQERRATRAIARHWDIPLATVRISDVGPFGSGLIPGRNALLLAAALCRWQGKDGTIALGIHGGTTYADCSTAFVDSMQRVFDVYASGRMRLFCPFIESNKKQVWDYCQQAGVPIKLTYSCERGGTRPCGRCLSCRDRRALNELG